MTLADAQVDIANIPDGSATYVRSTDDSALADEYINNGGTLEATGRRMISAGYVDALRDLITEEIARVMSTGAAVPLEGYPDVAWAWVDKEGKSTSETLSDGTTNLAALLLGNKIELVADDNDGITCQLRGTTTPLFSLSASGVVTFGDIRMFAVSYTHLTLPTILLV